MMVKIHIADLTGIIYDVCYRRDAGARSGQLSYGNRDAEVPYTEISSQTEVSDHEGDGDTVVPSQPDSQQSRLNVIYVFLRSNTHVVISKFLEIHMYICICK